VTLICHGHHIQSPFWNLKQRKLPYTEATMTQLFTPEELSHSTPDEINRVIRQAFIYDDFAWQKEKKIRISEAFRAEGLHKVLYQCPACRREFRMRSKGTMLFCTACGKRWEMTETGDLKSESGVTEFPHIPDW